MLLTGLVLLSLVVWVYLALFRGLFWLESPQPWPQGGQSSTPDVAVIIPARNEEAVIDRAVRSLLKQDYTGAYTIFLVDDHSSDNTAAVARHAAEQLGRAQRLKIVPAPPLPQGWSGKLWAMEAGVEAAQQQMHSPQYYFFTDADIEHGPSSLRELVARCETGKLTLASFMVKLNCQSWAEKFLIPAFVSLFLFYYPYKYVRDPKSSVAAAAGGAMLLRREALENAGGIPSIRSALIDDCALARIMKKQGPIWLGLTDNTFSVRPYPRLKSIWKMIARSAYAQLLYSPLLLLAASSAMALCFFVPVWGLLFGIGFTKVMGLMCWIIMAILYYPMVKFYRVHPAWALSMPAIATVYLLATLDSARRHWIGRGGEWKGRVQASRGAMPVQ
ncbi:MAG TPA: glycosyltransferase [Alphaproteobacteria bacterium]|nr:glycosyltransferase [Alphaproteobacteria bacterium]